MAHRQRFLSALEGTMPDQIPMTIWNNKLPGGKLNDRLLDLGVLVIHKSSVWRRRLEGIQVESRDETTADGNTVRHTSYFTPAGKLITAERVFPNTIWIEKYLFGDPGDYDALEALIVSRSYQPDFERFMTDDEKLADQSIARPMTIHSPMHELIYEFMGIENFSIEWAERRDRVLHLCDVLKQDWHKRLGIIVASPTKFAVIEGNIQLQVIGEERFLKYYFPNIQEACEILHEKGIFAGAHLDGNNRKLAPLIARTSLDFIESFTPPPDCDLSVAEARQIWKDKSLLVHFPSSVHLFGAAAIEDHVKEILKQAAPGDRFAIGVSEDVPNGGIETLVPLYEAIRKYGWGNSKLQLKNPK
ncbi:MAG: uroporphyrinogen decarboxylase family protein [candidate division KSB1 bacterium]|nr:uroporphyrinogen decarboxylase family protein [candidate division KSB1 bacterium]MDZ7400167.1 uroporphyrinogen decarboxylase family protein [candidate division KSB1 bacterium]